MAIFKEIPPTAGLPLHGQDLASLFKPGSLEEDLRRYLDVPYARVTCSGTAAFYFILETLKGLSDKKTVVLPSFVCPLVPLAVLRAGLKVELCDTLPDRFDLEPLQLQGLGARRDILAIVAVHLAGVPVDMAPVVKAASACGAFVVEDCAQALGAVHQGRKAGTHGDFSFFSFCRGKGLTLYEGGAAVARQEGHARALARTIERLQRPDPCAEAVKVLELLGYWIFYRPLLFWFVFKLPERYWLRRGDRVRAFGEMFAADFPTHRVSWLRQAVGHASFGRLEEGIARQRETAAEYFKGLRKVPGLRGLMEHPGDTAVYPYVTVVFDSPGARDKALDRLDRLGRGASIIYVHALPDYDYLRTAVTGASAAHGRHLAVSTLTLSTSGFLSTTDREAVLAELKG